ncbi:MAG: hypothetical protein AAFY78_08885 [Cyanobacteria bacterium J06648_16]
MTIHAASIANPRPRPHTGRLRFGLTGLGMFKRIQSCLDTPTITVRFGFKSFGGFGFDDVATVVAILLSEGFYGLLIKGGDCSTNRADIVNHILHRSGGRRVAIPI